LALKKDGDGAAGRGGGGGVAVVGVRGVGGADSVAERLGGSFEAMAL